jgi:hypothetical protein
MGKCESLCVVVGVGFTCGRFSFLQLQMALRSIISSTETDSAAQSMQKLLQVGS